MLAVAVGGLDTYSVLYHFSFHSLSECLWETEILSQKAVINQKGPTNQVEMDG